MTAARREVERRYRANHPDKVNAKKRRAYLRMKAAETQEQRAKRAARQSVNAARYRAKNRERILVREADWRAANRDKLREVQRRSYEKNKGKYLVRAVANARARYAAKRGEILAHNRERYKADQAYRASVYRNAQRRRAAVAQGTLTSEEWAGVFNFYEGRCVYCGDPAVTIDHVVPIVRGGTHSADNVVPACRSCNCRKRHRTPTEWYAATVNEGRAPCLNCA